MKLRFNQQFFLKNRNLNKWLGFLLALLIVVVTILVSNSIVKSLKIEESNKMENIVKAIELQGNGIDVSDDSRKFFLKIIEENKSMPMILMDESGVPSDIRNLGDELEKLENDSVYLHSKLKKMAAIHEPIEINLPFGNQYLYYANSNLLAQLQYYPVLLILILLGFAAFTTWYFRTLDASQRSFLWAGMAKETAHQIGTPLSSLLGWIELLKLEDIDQSTVSEMENDVKRLNQIADRFSKIGSQPELKSHDLVQIGQNTYDYLKPRISSGVDFQFRAKSDQLYAKCNPELLSWVLENLVRNAVDAMQNRGKIELKIEKNHNQAIISVRDDGSGIPIGLQKRIFEPGYTTKKRGWGLGLSLAKRIINDYHKGRIFVSESEKDQGTEFKIILKSEDKS